MKPSKKAVAFQFACAVSGCLSAMVAGGWVAWPAAALKELSEGNHGFSIGTTEKSLLVAFMDIGNVVSPIPSGYLMDWIGRKNTLLLTAIFYTTASISVMSATNIWYLYVARFMAGMGRGTVYVVVPYYLIEVASSDIRGSLSAMFIGFFNIGLMYDYLLGCLVSYQTLNILNLCLALVLGITIWAVPETPYFLVMHNMKEKARKSLIKYRMVQVDDSGNAPELDKELQEISATVARDMKTKGRMIDLVSNTSYRKALFIVLPLVIMQRLSGTSPTVAYSTIFMPENGGGLPVSYYMIIFSIILVFVNYLVLPIVDKVNRRVLLVISATTSCLVLGIAAIFYYFYKYNNAEVRGMEWIPYCCLLLQAITYSIGIGFIPSIIVVEMFPQNLKKYVGAFAGIVMALTSFVINRLFLEVRDVAGDYVMFSIFSTGSLITVIFTIFCVIETRGKSFSEIQNILNPILPSIPVDEP